MSLIFPDWTGEYGGIGVNAPGMTIRGGGAPTLKLQYAAVDAMGYKRGYLEFKTDSTADYRAVSVDAVDADAGRATVDVVGAFPVDLQTVEEVCVYLRAAGTSFTDFIRARIVLATGAISIDKMVSGIYTAGSGASAGTVTLGAGKNIGFRLRANGGVVSLKVWDYGVLGHDNEPAAFNLTPTGLAPTGVGSVAWGGRHSALTGRVAALNFLEIATGGDIAEVPLTEAEFDAWADDPNNKREVLVEATVLGFDETGAGSPAYTKKTHVYMSRMGFDSQRQDTPPLQHYQAILLQPPTFSVEMPAAMGGEAKVSIGSMIVSNPVEPLPPTAPALEFTQTHAGGGNCYTYRKISDAGGHVIAAGERLEYDFFINAANPSFNSGAGGVEVDYLPGGGTNNGRSQGLVDTLGDTCSALNAAHYQPGVWYSRTLPFVASMIGKTIMAIDLVNESDTAGVYKSQYRNLRITNSSGATVVQIWSSGAPSMNVDNYSQLSSQVSVRWIQAPLSASVTPTKSQRVGIRDDWARMKWDLNYLRSWVGSKKWKKRDFRAFVFGRCGQPEATNDETLEIKIADLSNIFQVDIQSTLFSGGDYSGQRQPIYMGNQGTSGTIGSGMFEPPCTDAANLIYTLSDGAIGNWNSGVATQMQVFDRLNSLRTGTLACASVVGNVINFTAPHGMTVNYVWVAPSSGALPAPLVNGVEYLVESLSGLNGITLKANRAGSVIVLTNTTLVAVASRGYGFQVNPAAPATIQLASGDPKAMRITVSKVPQRQTDVYSSNFGPGSVYRDICVHIGLSASNIDPTSNAGLADMFYWVDTEKRTAADVMAAIASGTLTFYGFSRDAIFYSGDIAVPTGPAKKKFGTYNIVDGSLRQTGTQRAVNIAKAEIRESIYFLPGGLFQSGSVNAIKGYSPRPLGTYSAIAPPLDDHSDAGETDVNYVATSYYTQTYRPSWADFYKRPLDSWQFVTLFSAFRRRLGEDIEITYPRGGFRTWDASDPASPDNTASVDGRLAKIQKISMGHIDDAAPVTIDVFKPKVGYYPQVDVL